MDNKKYYYLKLKDNFFDRPEIKAIESIPNGYEYICIMQKMYLRSLERDGKLMLTDTIPYEIQTLSAVLSHRIEVIKSAVEIFRQFGLLDVLDDKTIYMTEIQNFIGRSSSEGDRKREYRREIDQNKQLLLGGGGQMSDKRPPEIEKELKIELEKEIDSVVQKWNNFSIKYNLNKISKLSDKREKGVKERLLEKEFDFDKILSLIATSDFLKGSKGWKVTFDYIFTSKNNYIKILEGNFNGKPTGQQPKYSEPDKSFNVIG